MNLNKLGYNSMEDLDNDAKTIDAWYWAYGNEIKLQSSPFKKKGHEYQVDILQCDNQRQAAKKAAQMAFTETAIIKTLHGMLNSYYPQGVLYLFPTQGDVKDFSQARLKTLTTLNPFHIGRFIKNTDNVNIKQIKNALLYFRGAHSSKKIEGTKATSTRLKSIPVDRIVFDEFDEMDPTMVDLALERFSHSNIQEEFYLSTPTIPDYGIDKKYQESDQRVWMIKCRKCGKETCLELEFPECLHEMKDGTVIRQCIHCRDRELYPADGRWIAQYPEKSNDLIGWWISQLNSAYINPKTIIDLFNNPPNGNIAEVYNSKLGMAYIAAEDRLTVNDVYRCCGHEPILSKHQGPCAMGADIGKIIHVVIGNRKSERAKRILFVGRVSSFNDLHDLGKRFNVKSAVLDLEPEIRKVREFQKAEPYKVFLCDYQERQKVSRRKDEEGGLIAVRRTEICDATHDLVKTEGMLEIPRMSSEVKKYALEMSNIAKVLEEDQKTGRKTYKYRKLGADHYRHATNYFTLACEDPALNVSSIDMMRSSIREEKQAYETNLIT